MTPPAPPPFPAAVFFDFDGVIVDTEPIHYAAFTDALRPEGLAFSRAVYDALYIGYDDREAIETAFRTRGRLLSPDLHARLMRAKAEAFVCRARDCPPAPLPGVMAFIVALRERGIPMALCSGALPCDIDPILERVGLSDVFSVRVTAADVERSKPDPASYRLALERLSQAVGRMLVPGECMAIEDTAAGIASACGAGLRVLAVATTCPRDSLAGANWVLPTLDNTTPDDLSQWLT